jgi:tellurite resistance protein TehA-like permease
MTRAPAASAPAAPAATLGARVREGVRDLFTGYPALVMATGIVSVASARLGYEPIARALFWVNVVAFVVLGVLLGLRVAWYPRRVLEDLTSHQAGPGFLTLVAGLGVLGSQALLLADAAVVATAALWVALVLWAGMLYTFLTAVTVRAVKPQLAEALSGAWLLLVVATQSIAVLGSLLALRDGEVSRPAALFLLGMYLVGGMLYLCLINLVLYRFTFFALPPENLSPPYWINMGAVAITTLAGANLVLLAPSSPLLGELRPFLAGFTLFFFAFATWWIPLLFVLGFWRHFVRRVPLRYHPSYWGMVFPLGMYATCTVQLARALDLPFLLPLARAFGWIALLAWAIVFAGLLGTLARFARGR